MSMIEKLRIFESIVRVPIYDVIGAIGNNRIAYVSNVNNIMALWILNPSTGEKIQISKDPIAGAARTKSYSNYAVFIRDIAAGKELHRIYIADIESRDIVELKNIEPMRILSIAFNGKYIAFTASKERSIELYVVDLDGNTVVRRELHTLAYVTDLNHRYVVGYGPLYGDLRSSELMVLDISSGSLKVFTPRRGSKNRPPMKLVGSKVVFQSDFEGKNKMYIYDIEKNRLEELRFTHRDYYEYQPVENVDIEWVDGNPVVVGKRDGRTKIFIDGREIPSPPGSVRGIAVIGTKIYCSISSLRSPWKIYEIDAQTGNTRVVLENELSKDIEELLGDVRFVKYRSFDGLEIPAYVVESRKISKPGPTVIYIHGGPFAEVADMWSSVIAALVACGYHVIAPNFRGSTGYGSEFMNKLIGDPGGGDLEDIVAAYRWAITNGLADKDRVAVFGYSYGGYLSLLALTRYPNLWRCGVAGASIVDWEEMYRLADASFKKAIELIFGGKKKKLFRERSPITYIDKIKAPICIIHPQNDTRTPLRPVLRMISRLYEMGKSFEVHIVPDIGHAPTTVDDIIKLLLPTITFLDKYMR